MLEKRFLPEFCPIGVEKPHLGNLAKEKINMPSKTGCKQSRPWTPFGSFLARGCERF